MTAPLPILGVHGIHNRQKSLTPAAAAARIAGWWSDALRTKLGDGNFTLDLAYYAHHLHGPVAQGADDPATLPPEVQQDLLRWAELVDPGRTPQGSMAAVVRGAADRIARRSGLDQAMVRSFVYWFARELHRYFGDPASRAAAVAEVRAAITRTQPKMIIAHSLGSVVCYEALWADPAPVDLLVTVGSPLAMPDLVFDRLTPHAGDRGRPPGVRQWINIADPGDIVAIPIGGVAARFTGVHADLTDAIHAFDVHRATNYLRCGALFGVVAAHLPVAGGLLRLPD